MATFREIMDAAHRADAAGDTDAAKRFLQIASDIQSGKGYTPAAEQPKSELVLPQAEGYAPGSPQFDRFGDTINAATKEPRQAFRHFAGEVMDGENAPLDRAKAAGMAALSGLGTTYAAGAGLVGEVLGGSPTNERKLARDLMLMGEVSAPELAGVSSTARLAGSAARQTAKIGDNAGDAARTARAADDLGITPALGATSKTQAQVAAGLEKVPFSGSVIAKDAMRFVDDIEEAFGAAVERVGSVRSPEGAGAALQSGLGKFTNEFKTKSGKLYADVGAHIPRDMLVQTPDTVKMIREAIAPFADKPVLMKRLGLNEWADIADDLETGLSWEAASALRSDIGKSVGKINGALADMDQGRLKMAYGRLTADMEAAAKSAGPDAEKAWKRASNYYRKGAQRIESALDKTIKADSPERAFEAFANFAKKDRATSDVRRLYSIKASMPAEDWATVSASIIDRLGRKGDDFSPSHFVTQWGKMSDEAKSVLLTPQARKEMDSLISVAEGAKRINAERNFSNTGNAGAIIAMFFGGAVSPVATTGAVAGANLTARAMTSPRFLRAANRMARGDEKMMKAIAKSNSPFAQDAQTVLRLASADAAGGSAANSNERIRRQTAR